MLNFSYWLMSEMAHLAMPGGIEINGKKVAFIDMNFEKYPPEMQKMLKMWMYTFSAPLPDSNLYLTYRKGQIKIGAPLPHKQATMLPNDWWERATVVYEDESVKNPTI